MVTDRAEGLVGWISSPLRPVSEGEATGSFMTRERITRTNCRAGHPTFSEARGVARAAAVVWAVETGRSDCGVAIVAAAVAGVGR